MKIVLKIIVIIVLVLGFWGIAELVELIPFYKGLQFKDVHSINRLFMILINLATMSIGFAYGYSSYYIGFYIFDKIKTLKIW